MNAQDEQQWRDTHAAGTSVRHCQLLQSSKDTCNNKLEGVGPKDHCPFRCFHRRGQGASMVLSKGAGGAVDNFIEGRQGGGKQGTPHAQWDMRGISPAICSREGVASIYLFPNQIFFELVNRNEGACLRCLRFAIQQSCWQDNKKTRSANKIQRDKGYKRIDKFNRNNLKSEQQQQRNIAAREAAL